MFSPENKIVLFGSYSAEQAQLLKDELGISMPLQMLAYCAQYYRLTARRDPFADELQMLDRLSVAFEGELEAYSVSAFDTDDACAARAYADMIAKRRTLKPNAKYPITLREAAEIADDYLLRAGQYPNPKHRLLPLSMRDSVMKNACHVTASGAPFGLTPVSMPAARAKAGELLIFVAPECEQSPDDFAHAYNEFLNTPSAGSLMRGIVQVPKSGGILRALLSLCDGAQIIPSAAIPAKEGTAMDLTAMTAVPALGASIISVADGSQAPLLDILHSLGLFAAVFAKVTSDGIYAIKRYSGEVILLQSSFLRSLFRRTGIRLLLSPEGAPEPISHNTVFDVETEAKKGHFVSEVRERDGTVVAASFSTPTSSYLTTALYTTLIPILSLCACGIDRTVQTLSFGVEYPASITDNTAAETFSLLLGVYRVQAELGIPAETVCCRAEAAVAHPTLTAFSVAEGFAYPSVWEDADHPVYLLTPALEADGLPDFASLRSLADRLYLHPQRSVIRAFSVVCGETLTAGIARMNGDFICAVQDASEAPIPFGILLECTEQIDAEQIGVTAPCDPTVFRS